jgi:hypothetical protein
MNKMTEDLLWYPAPDNSGGVHMSDAERPPGAELAPIYSNHFSIISAPDIVRISFGEVFASPGSAVFHATIALTPADAQQLAKTLSKVMAEWASREKGGR